MILEAEAALGEVTEKKLFNFDLRLTPLVSPSYLCAGVLHQIYNCKGLSVKSALPSNPIKMFYPVPVRSKIE